MKTAMHYMLEEMRNYQNESGNDSISIDLIEKGINVIYGNLEKQQIIDLCTEAYELGLGHKEYDAKENFEQTFKNE